MKKFLNNGVIPSVNFHLWEPCNMRCKFCFATFQDVKQSILPKGHLPKEDALRVVNRLADFGFEKITFVGGEPLLCPWLEDLILAAKRTGMITMLVTNGSRLSSGFLERNVGLLDWITLSIDSLNEDVNILSGRARFGKRPLSRIMYEDLVTSIKSFGYLLKINTVVHQLNYQEDMSPFMSWAAPDRWKVFQVLPVVGQNDQHFDDFFIGQDLFDSFLKRHSSLMESTNVVAEDNDLMRGTYAMVDPAGRFFDNTSGGHRYSEPILDVGVEAAIKGIEIDLEGFMARDGYYY